MKSIIKEIDIINTYNERQQNQCKLYYQYKQLKKENPTFGYKRIATLMSLKYSKTRWWHCGKHTPTPIQTTDWLKSKGILPLNENNSNILLISKVLGALFGDGGIFGNLNGIFLSSSELEAVQEFGSDLKKLFGNEIEKNSRIIEGGEYGHSWCYQNTNRNLIRFFIALGAPLGDKSFIQLNTPKWIIDSKENIQDQFFASLLGGELGVPKVHISGNQLDSLSLGITGKDELAENRIFFLKSLAYYLNNKGIKTCSISINNHKKCNRKGEPTKIYRLLISTELGNIIQFVNCINMNYCFYKNDKIQNTLTHFYKIKQSKYQNLKQKGYSHKKIRNLLRLDDYSSYLMDYNTR